ncbi:hypothetical protein WJX84_003195 [Apatococcus fuscideae]|uniref:Uncharacterized protein n=1 Tax=Apatococcus fuscideae TaxID=2026836 RepID=A0AAW1T7J3_9CHLO
MQESSLLYNIRMNNGSCAHLHVYCVYDYEVIDVVQLAPDKREYEWECVTRDKCSHGCKGPVLMPMQRFGRHLGGRKGEAKTPSSLHISVDEASNHVGVRNFRLLFGVFAQDSKKLLGTAVTQPIRVFVNNDVPKGAGYIEVTVRCDDDWTGWKDAAGPGSAVALQHDEHLERVVTEDHARKNEAPSPSPGTPQMVPDRQILCRSPKPSSSMWTDPCSLQNVCERDMISAFPSATKEGDTNKPDASLNPPVHMMFTTRPDVDPEDFPQPMESPPDPASGSEGPQHLGETSQERTTSAEDGIIALDESDDEEAMEGPDGGVADAKALDKHWINHAPGKASDDAGDVGTCEWGC